MRELRVLKPSLEEIKHSKLGSIVSKLSKFALDDVMDRCSNTTSVASCAISSRVFRARP